MILSILAFVNFKEITSCEDVVNSVECFSDNFEEYIKFTNRLFDVLRIKLPSQKNQGFILDLVKELLDFNIEKGNPNLTFIKPGIYS